MKSAEISLQPVNLGHTDRVIAVHNLIHLRKFIFLITFRSNSAVRCVVGFSLRHMCALSFKSNNCLIDSSRSHSVRLGPLNRHQTSSDIFDLDSRSIYPGKPYQ